MATMGKVAAALVGAEAVEAGADGVAKAVCSALGGRAQDTLELAEGEFDGVRAVRREV